VVKISANLVFTGKRLVPIPGTRSVSNPRESGENDALQAAAAMRKGKVVDLTASLALTASRLSLAHHLPMADSIILATAEEFNASIWTQDSHLKDMAHVRYLPKAMLPKRPPVEHE
jgi:predicted nucleic acid-binding protein